MFRKNQCRRSGLLREDDVVIAYLLIAGLLIILNGFFDSENGFIHIFHQIRIVQIG